jgi:hypothetical protein
MTGATGPARQYDLPTGPARQYDLPASTPLTAKVPSLRMRDLAPDIARQRLLIEGFYTVQVDAALVERYLTGIAAHLGLRTYGRAIVHAPDGAGKDENQGFDAFIPLVDSGISLYVWSGRRFFAAVLFSCKAFDVNSATAFTREFFAATELEDRSF